MSLTRAVALLAVVGIAALVYEGFIAPPPGPRSLRVFDPDRVADLEIDIYEAPRDRVLPASVLRARAGKLRDDGGGTADWGAVSALLHQSYRELRAAFPQ